MCSTPPVSGNVVLVHGAWSSPSDWHWVRDLLIEHGVRVDVPDLASHRVPGATHADDVDQVSQLLAAAPGPVVVAGWSYGGSVLTDLDVSTLDIQRLIYVAAVPGVPPADPVGDAPPVELDLSHLLFSDDGTVVLDNDWFVTSDPVMDTLPPEVVEHFRTHPRRPLPVDAALAPPVRTAWREVATTVILGRADPLCPEPRQEWVKHVVEDTRIVDSDHFIPFRRPDLVAGIILEALAP